VAETRHDHLKAQILEAAESVVHHFGYSKTTMQDIAKALRKAKSSLYHYFSSKEQIFVELLHKEIAELRSEFLKAVDAETTPEGKIRAYILTRTRMFRQKLQQHMSFAEETPERLELLMKIHQEYDPVEISILSGILAAGMAAGRFMMADATLTATAILHVLKGFEFPFLRETDGKGIEEKLDHTLTILFYGIVPR
jgi:AcrR family transcriptional regulator